MIERFIFTLTRTIKTNIIGKGKPRCDTIRTHWHSLVSYLTFQYEDISKNYSRRQVERIKHILRQEISSGNLTKGTWAKKQWLGFVSVSRMVHAYLAISLEYGVRSWDEVFNKVLGVLLQTACASRNGDIIYTDIYRGERSFQ